MRTGSQSVNIRLEDVGYTRQRGGLDVGNVATMAATSFVRRCVAGAFVLAGLALLFLADPARYVVPPTSDHGGNSDAGETGPKVLQPPSLPALPHLISFTHDEPSVKFFIIGDWGTGNNAQRDTAKVFTALAETARPSFIVSTGDQFYPFGVNSIEDDKFDTIFQSVYSSPSLQVPWYIVLGNHDCYGSTAAYEGYGSVDKRWTMPHRYYAVRHTYQGFTALMVHIDACLFVCAHGNNYRCDDRLKAASGTEQQFQDHLSWVKRVLSESDADWKFVVGHWPIYSYLGNGPTLELIETLAPLLIEHDVHAYFHGHDHSLQHTVLKDKALPQFIGSGAGGYTLHPVLKAEADPLLNAGTTNLFAKPQFGFVEAVLSKDTLHLTYLGAEGDSTRTLFETTIPRVAGN